MKKTQQRRRTYIREWRKHRKLTLEQLAEKIGDVSQGGLSMLERGQRGYTQESLEKIAEALDTDAAALLTHGPTHGDADLWSMWAAAEEGQRQQIIEVVKTLTKTRH